MMEDTNRNGMLPPEQPYIQTSAVRCFLSCSQLLSHTPYGDAMMGIAVGASGVGKSVALRYYQEQLAPKDASSKSISISVYPRSTPPSLISQLLDAFEWTTHMGQYANKLDGLAEAVRRQERRLVTLDEAERLSDACLELLCTLFDMTGCPLFLVGLPEFLQRSRKHPQLWSRVGLYLKFPPLSFQEVLHKVLPALVIPRWVFDPEREADRLMAGQLWEYTSPSLRRLRNVLGIASTLAHMQHETRVTQTCIQRVMQLTSPPLDQVGRRSQNQSLSKTHEAEKTIRSGAISDR